jgi:hypothetical protein
MIDSPRTFISYASDDLNLARTLADDLQKHAVPVWFDEYEIGLNCRVNVEPLIENAFRSCQALVKLHTRARKRRHDSRPPLHRPAQPIIDPGRDRYLSYEAFIWINSTQPGANFKSIELVFSDSGYELPTRIERGMIYRYRWHRNGPSHGPWNFIEDRGAPLVVREGIAYVRGIDVHLPAVGQFVVIPCDSYQTALKLVLTELRSDSTAVRLFLSEAPADQDGAIPLDRVRARAYELWEARSRRELAGTSDQDWFAAIDELKWGI